MTLRQQSRARFAGTFDPESFPREDAARIYGLVREGLAGSVQAGERRDDE